MTPELLYDGDCGFCARSAVALSRHGTRFPIRAWQEVADLDALGLSQEEVTSAAYWRTGTHHYRGAAAIGHALVAGGRLGQLAGHLILTPALAPLARWVYAAVAANRHRLPGRSASCRMHGGDKAA